MIPFLQRLWLRRWFRICTWTGISLLTILILVRQYIGWSGTRHWAAVQRMITHDGESIDFNTVVPDPVPDDQNFCDIPLLKDLPLLTGTTDPASELGKRRQRLFDATNPFFNVSPGTRPNTSLGVTLGKPADLHAYAAWLRTTGAKTIPPDSGNSASDILAALAYNDDLIHELAGGLDRPESQWSPAWKNRHDLPEALFSILLPHIGISKRLDTMLCLRAVAAAQAGQSAEAQQSILIALRISEANFGEPTLIENLVGCANASMITSAIWEACNTHSGTAEDFRKLQQELTRSDFQKSRLLAGRGEMVFGPNTCEYMKRTRDPSPFDAFSDIRDSRDHFLLAPLIAHILPDGFFDSVSATGVEWRYQYDVKPLRDSGFPALVASEKEFAAKLEKERSELPFRHLDNAFALMFMPPLLNLTARNIYAESLVNEAIAACALERYRIAHGAYPDTLEAANNPGEKSIPADVMSGKPMGYRKTADGRYALWTFGFDGHDHGGTRSLDEGHIAGTKFADISYKGDWVWDFPPMGENSKNSQPSAN